MKYGNSAFFGVVRHAGGILRIVARDQLEHLTNFLGVNHDLYNWERLLLMAMEVKIGVHELRDFSTLGSCLGLGCLRTSR